MTSWPEGLDAKPPVEPQERRYQWEGELDGSTAPQWFRRFGDVPGNVVTLPRTVERTFLEGHDYEPVLDGHSLRWPVRPGHGSQYQAPCLQSEPVDVDAVNGAPPPTDSDIEASLQAMCEQLELPGTFADYVKLLSGGFRVSHRREPTLATHLDAQVSLAWLYARAVARWPEVLRAVAPQPDATYAPVVPSTVDLFIREGHTGDLSRFVALLQKTGQRFVGLDRARTQLAEFTMHRERLTQLEEQHAA